MKRWSLERTTEATEDLFDIWAYVASDNRAAADKLFGELTGLFERTADFPELGRAIEHLVPGHRALTRGRYLLIYRILPGRHAVELVRVVHSARNWPELFDS